MSETTSAKGRAPFFPLVMLTGVVMAVVLSPAPELVSVGLMILATVPAGVVLGLLAGRYRRKPLPGWRGFAVPVVVGVFGSVLGLLAVNVIFRTFFKS